MEHFLTKEQYQTMKSAWAAKKHHSAQYNIIYNLLRSHPIDRGFIPFKHAYKAISNYNDHWRGFNFAQRNMYYSIKMVKAGFTPTPCPKFTTEQQWVVKEQQKQTNIENLKKQFFEQFFENIGLELNDTMLDHILVSLEGKQK